MQNTTVVSGLMPRRSGFLFKNEDLNPGIAADNLVSGREAHDPCACNGNFHISS